MLQEEVEMFNMFELRTEKSPGNCFDTSEKEWCDVGS